jgi:hypothetical protein
VYNYYNNHQWKSVIMKSTLVGRQSRGKQIIYRFNGDPKYDETISDRIGDLPFRRVGDMIEKRGKEWRVAVVRDDFNISASRTVIPIHRVFLTDKF